MLYNVEVRIEKSCQRTLKQIKLSEKEIVDFFPSLSLTKFPPKSSSSSSRSRKIGFVDRSCDCGCSGGDAKNGGDDDDVSCVVCGGRTAVSKTTFGVSVDSSTNDASDKRELAPLRS